MGAGICEMEIFLCLLIEAERSEKLYAVEEGTKNKLRGL
jgi:hypothetical protein